MSHTDFIAHYRAPVTTPDAPRPVLEFPGRYEGLARSLAGRARRRIRGRRLAYLDSHFPWQLSGFRYADALALYEARSDTVFFSMYEMNDPFPAPVLPLAQFPRLAPSLGITDVYGVFLNFMSGIVGVERGADHVPSFIEGLDISGVLRREGIRAYAGLHPGGGFVTTEAGLAEARRLVSRADRVFSWAPAVLENVPGVTPIDPAVIDTAYYARTPRDFAARPLQLLFAADAKPRKGLGVALGAMARLAAEPVHLHVVGPHDPGLSSLPAHRTTFHGWLSAEHLRELHRRCHVFLSPVRAEVPGDPSDDGGITDGFPTTAAAEAASSGLLLMTSNPERNHRQLRPGVDHVELPATEAAYADAVRAVLASPGQAAATAETGAQRIRERLDVRIGADSRLRLMGLSPGRAAYASPSRGNWAAGLPRRRRSAPRSALDADAPRDRHASALRLHAAGRTSEAMHELIAEVQERLRDSELLNDLGVLAAEVGEPRIAESLLRTALFISPEAADVGANLAALDALRGQGFVSRLVEALVSVALGSDVPDDFDPSSHPEVSPGPSHPLSPSVIEVMSHAPQLEGVYRVLADDTSRELMVRSFALGLLGTREAARPGCVDQQRQLLDSAESLRVETGRAAQGGLTGGPDRYDLGRLGSPVVLDTHASNIVSTFLLEQYACPQHPSARVAAGDTVIDGGADWGDAALYFASRVGPGGRVVSYEFSPAKIDRLKANLALNPTLAAHVEVKERAIDGTLGALGLDRIDFIKLDIAGAELRALAGAEQLLRRFRPRLAVTLHPDIAAWIDIPAYLDGLALGYRFSLGHFTIRSAKTILFAWSEDEAS